MCTALSGLKLVPEALYDSDFPNWLILQLITIGITLSKLPVN